MTCEDIIERGIDEDYLLGRLNDAEREEFEQHYFVCDRCYTRLEQLRAVRDALAEPAGTGAVTGTFRRRREWQWLAAAAALAVAIGAAWLWRASRTEAPERTQVSATREAPTPAPVPQSVPRQQPDLPEEVMRLARVEPPPYSPSRLRGAAPGPRESFERGMARYTRRDFVAAIPLLERAAQEDRGAEDARFYLGASYLLAGRQRDAIETWRANASTPASPFVEEARFLTAKAWLQLGDIPQARSALDQTIALRGDREREARMMRERLAKFAAVP